MNLERDTPLERPRVPGLHETFYAVTASRQFPHPLVKTLLKPEASGNPRA